MKHIILCFISFFIVSLTLNSHAADDHEQVSLQLLWKHQFQFAGYYIAKEKGFYDTEKLNVDIREYQKGINVVKTILDKEADFAVGRSSILANKGNGAPIIALYAAFQKSPLMLLTRGDIRSPAELKGKRMMLTNDAVDVAEIQAMLIKAGVFKDDYIHQDHTFNILDLINGNTDVMGAYVSNEPFQMSYLNQPYSIIHPEDYGFNMYSDILFTHKQMSTENPELTKKFFEASVKGWIYAFDHIEETAKIIFEKYNTQNRTLDALIYEGEALKKLSLIGGIPFGSINQGRLEAMASVYLISGHLNNQYEISDFIYSGNSSAESKPNHDLLWQLAAFVMFVIGYLLYRNIMESKRNLQLVVIAEHDQLTKLFNRHKLIDSLSEYINLSARYQWKLSCIFIDIDNFKNVNDIFGHNMGDLLLKEFAKLLTEHTRRTDIIGRWGGEEFVIILPETSVLTAEEIATKLCETVFNTQFCVDQQISCSLGVTQYRKDETNEEFIGRADDALYIAKHAGKNRTAVL
ncbi:GGDEF domain-containing protein [Neptunomonas antarctica]|uniref:diguanylate cyclase n=1 Tax=Neptunomonas antarctica TaxID=619304 RepID=A0A1N7NFK5_9GAMM|nr:GGDEF domain-containing protein [Neptunomonas antarctica]SIS97100.1 diguanylate cyclase (GGDEF) domain-containing protein [Neptunomonas antarctica]